MFLERMAERLSRRVVSACEPVERLADRILHRFAAGMPGVADNHEVRVGLDLWNTGSKSLPLLRKEAACTPIEPVDLRPPGRGHARDDDLRHPLWVALCVSEDQRRSPRPSVQEPALDSEMFAQALH